jgi:hypothetical protein
MTTQTTIGQLVASLYAEYEDRYHDTRLAAIATHDAIVNLTGGQRRVGDFKAYAARSMVDMARSTWESLYAEPALRLRVAQAHA